MGECDKIFKGNVRITQIPHSRGATLNAVKGIINKLHALEGIYLERYPDVRNFRFRPLFHWTFWGIRERRTFFPNIRLSLGSNKATITATFDTKSFQDSKIPEEVIAQFENNSVHEWALPTAHQAATTPFSIFPGSAIRLRTGLDPDKVIPYFEKKYDAVFVVSKLVTGGAEKYLSEVASTTSDGSLNRILFISTEDTQSEFSERELPATIERLRESDHLFWNTNLGFPNNEETFARFIRGLSCRTLFVCNSDLGYRMLIKFHRGISTSTKLVAIFFSFGTQESVTYARLYVRKLIGKVLLLTDNSKFAKDAQKIAPIFSPEKIAVIPAPCSATSPSQFSKKIDKRFSQKQGKNNWLWIGRIEKLKDIEALAVLAMLRPRDSFNLFGTVEKSTASSDLLKLPNVRYRGLQKDWEDFPFEEYAGLIFTSAFEGMPNVLLECAQQAIPLFISDVGGVRDTFDEDNSTIVVRETTPNLTADNFNDAITNYLSLPIEIRKNKIMEAFNRVNMLHSQVEFAKHLKLFTRKENGNE